MSEEKNVELEEENRPTPCTLKGIEIKKDSFLVFHHEKLNVVATDDEYKKLVKEANENATTYEFKDIKSISYRHLLGKGRLIIKLLDPKAKPIKETFVYGKSYRLTNIGSVVLDLDVKKLKIEFKKYTKTAQENANG